MKVIMTLKQGNTDEKNFTRELEVTPQEYEYLMETSSCINQNGEEYMGVYIYKF